VDLGPLLDLNIDCIARGLGKGRFSAYRPACSGWNELQARTAIKLKEPKPGVYVVLGYSLRRQKKAEEARRSFQQFLKINPSGPMADDMKSLIAQIDQRTEKR
jgi:uncharacterized protein HemY